jgi:hypothetical protein
MITDGTNIYFGSGDKIKKVSILSGPVEIVGNGYSATIDSTKLYFSSPSTSTSPPTLKSAPLSGGPVVTLAQIPPMSTDTNDGDWIYGVQSVRSQSGDSESHIAAISKSNPANIITMAKNPSVQVTDDCNERYTAYNPKVYGQYLYFTVIAYKYCRSINRTDTSFYIERVAKM